jgi:8-oxo-dGTP diphosphatase
MTTIQQRVVAAVIRDGDRFLICQRPAPKRHGGLWEFPGGKCEASETDEQAITRELAEELGVEVSAVGDALFAACDPDSPFVIAFLHVEIRGEPLCIEHAALAWASLHEMTAYELAPSDARFVNFLGLEE